MRERKSPTSAGEKQEERHNCPLQHLQPHNPQEGPGTLCLKIYLPPGLFRAAASSAKASELANAPLVHQEEMKLVLSKCITALWLELGDRKMQMLVLGNDRVAGSTLFISLPERREPPANTSAC